MKHKNLSTLIPLYNLVKIGNNIRYKYTDTSNNNNIDERKDFVNLVRTHGYDILVPGDFRFAELETEYNRVIELQAKYEGYSTYTKCKFSEICVCGEWLFTEKDYGIITEEIPVSDNRGGKREGSGRKSKNTALLSTETTSIRVPKLYKQEIKELIDWLVEKASNGENVKSALVDAMAAMEDDNHLEQKGILHELFQKLPNFYTKKQ